VRSGCSVTIGARPGVPQLMPSDPDPPEVVCAMAGSGVTRTYDADVTLRGTWRSDGPAAAIALDHETTMRCVPETIDGQALVSCTIEGGDLDRRGLTLGGRVHLDRRPGLVERLDHAQQLVLDRR
jgi:hypothetical protein